VDPPSALLSPAKAEAVAWLATLAQAYVGLMVDAQVAPRLQVGEPWWWVMGDGRIRLYDDAAKAAFGGNPPVINDMRATLSTAQKALLDQAGACLASATASIAAAAKSRAATLGHACETLLLAFLPTVLAPDTPEALRANLPVDWAAPAFDRLQVEDYDWLTAGQSALRARPMIWSTSASPTPCPAGLSGRFRAERRSGSAMAVDRSGRQRSTGPQCP
jgi:hypothetical protein